MSSIKAPAGRAAEDLDNEISVQFQSIANSELWWSNFVHEGNRLGIVARHMSRRTRVQRKSAAEGAGHGSEPGGGGGNNGSGARDELHGYQGRWFCLVQAPNSMIDTRAGPTKLKIAKALPGAYSLVQIWNAPSNETQNPLRGKRKRSIAAMRAAGKDVASDEEFLDDDDMVDASMDGQQQQQQQQQNEEEDEEGFPKRRPPPPPQHGYGSRSASRAAAAAAAAAAVSSSSAKTNPCSFSSSSVSSGNKLEEAPAPSVLPNPKETAAAVEDTEGAAPGEGVALDGDAAAVDGPNAKGQQNQQQNQQQQQQQQQQRQAAAPSPGATNLSNSEAVWTTSGQPAPNTSSGASDKPTSRAPVPSLSSSSSSSFFSSSSSSSSFSSAPSAPSVASNAAAQSAMSAATAALKQPTKSNPQQPTLRPNPMTAFNGMGNMGGRPMMPMPNMAGMNSAGMNSLMNQSMSMASMAGANGKNPMAEMQNNFANAVASAVANNRDKQVDDLQRTAVVLKSSIASLQSQLDSERAQRARLETKVNIIMSAFPVPPSLVPQMNSGQYS